MHLYDLTGFNGKWGKFQPDTCIRGDKIVKLLIICKISRLISTYLYTFSWIITASFVEEFDMDVVTHGTEYIAACLQLGATRGLCVTDGLRDFLMQR